MSHRPNDGNVHVWEPIRGVPEDSWWRCTACGAQQQRLTILVPGLKPGSDR